MAILLVTAFLAASCGGDADDEGASGPTSSVPVDQTVEVSMVDIAFKPEAISVKAGTTVRFVFTNDGQLPHEAAFGDEATQDAVASGKAKRDGPEVGPNKTKDYIRTFTTPGSLVIGCHIPGHYAAGMKIRLTVA
ncbi:MAG: cupredoxin domain-containing protein [Acidimicrobiales bacterium]